MCALAQCIFHYPQSLSGAEIAQFIFNIADKNAASLLYQHNTFGFAPFFKRFPTFLYRPLARHNKYYKDKKHSVNTTTEQI